MARPIDGPPATSSFELRVTFPRAVWTVVALLPIWVLFGAWILAPSFFDPLFVNPPGIAGFPAGIALNGISLALMTLGVAVMRRTTSRPKAMLAFGLFTIPAVLLVIFGPAVILIIQNIAT